MQDFWQMEVQQTQHLQITTSWLASGVPYECPFVKWFGLRAVFTSTVVTTKGVPPCTLSTFLTCKCWDGISNCRLSGSRGALYDGAPLGSAV